MSTTSNGAAPSVHLSRSESVGIDSDRRTAGPRGRVSAVLPDTTAKPHVCFAANLGEQEKRLKDCLTQGKRFPLTARVT